MRNTHSARSLATITACCLTMTGREAATSPNKTRYELLQFGFDRGRPEDGITETTTELVDVARIKRLFSGPVAEVADGAPVEPSDVAPTTGSHDPDRTAPSTRTGAHRNGRMTLLASARTARTARVRQTPAVA